MCPGSIAGLAGVVVAEWLVGFPVRSPLWAAQSAPALSGPLADADALIQRARENGNKSLSSNDGKLKDSAKNDLRDAEKIVRRRITLAEHRSASCCCH